MKRMVIAMVVVAAAVFGARAADDQYSLGVPSVTPIRDTANVEQNLWLASNAVHVAMSSCFTNDSAISSVDSSRIGATEKYCLVSAEVGFSWERLKPEYYLGDRLDAPPNVNWAATYVRYNDLQAEFAKEYERTKVVNPLAGGFLFSLDEIDPCVYVTEGGTHQFDWVLESGETNSLVYVLASVARGRPQRIYWTDYPYNGQKISLQDKFVKFYGNPELIIPGTGVVSKVIGGQVVSQTNVITRGLYLDESSMTLEARGRLSGQVVMVYYDSGNYDKIHHVQVLELSQPDVIPNFGVIGTALKANGRGYNVDGLKAVPAIASLTDNDNRGAYLYQHMGLHSYSPKNGEVFPLRPTNNNRSLARVTWMETDAMGVQFPFEIDEYEITWPEDISCYVRGDANGDYGADIVITNAYTAELQRYQEPENHARAVDANGHFRTIREGKSLLKLSSDDNVWFLPIQSVKRSNEKFYTLTASRVNVGAELELRGGTRSGLAPGVVLNATDALPGYVYQAGTLGKNYDQNLYSETNSASAIYPVSTNGNIEVWWSEWFQKDDMPAPIAIPTLPQVYHPLWPQLYDAPQIVIASQEGSANEVLHARHGAAYFDTPDAMMALPNRSYFSEVYGGTVMFWTRSDHFATDPAPATTNAPGRLLTVANGKNGPIVIEIGKNSSSPVIRAHVGNKRLAWPLPQNDAPNAWHHVAVTFDGAGGNPNLYVDNVETATLDEEYDFDMSSDLPEGYLAAEYIESTLGGGQYIDTGVAAKTGVKVEARALWTTEKQDSAFIGARKGDGDTRFYPIWYFKGALSYGHRRWVSLPKAKVPANRAVYIVSDFTTAGRATIKVDNSEYEITDLGDAFDTGLTMYLGALNFSGSAGSYMQGRIYSCKIYEGAELKRDFVPCIRVEGWTAGLYDKANNKFYPNAGKNAFRTDWDPDNTLGAADGNHLTAVGREMAEVKFFNSCLTADEIAEERYASRSGDEIGITGYFSFRKGEDLVSVIQSSGGDARAFQDRTMGEDWCVARNVAFVEPGAPAKGGVVLQSDTTPVIYYQNNPNAPDFNPNDEHAFVREGSGGYVVWALRDDLGTATTPPPGVFVEYTAGGKNRLQFFHVLATNDKWKYLRDSCEAGQQLPGPKPLLYFPDPWLKDDWWEPVQRGKVNCLAPAYRDRKGQIWARAAGTLNIHMFYAMQEGFYFPSLGANAQPAIGTPIPWLARHENKNADVLNGNPAAWQWNISWPKNVNTMKIGQTLTTAVDGLPEVWNAKSVSVVYPVGFPGNMASHGDVATNEVPVMLSDPTVMVSTNLTAAAFKSTGLSIDANGGLTYKGGKYHFTELPPSLSSRLYYDNTNQKLCFIGERVEKNAGATVLYPNVLSKAERTAILNLVKTNATGYAAWTNAVSSIAKEPVLTNTQLPKNNNGEVATTYKPVDHYALTALGPVGYVTLIENDASASNMLNGAACPVNDGDSINMRVFLVTNLYYTGRIVTRQDEVNLLSQQLSVLYTEPFGGKPDDFEFEWRHAAPNQDGTIPESYDNPQIYGVRPVNTGCGEVIGSTNTIGRGLTRFVVGQQGDTLANMVNTYWICRYRAVKDTPAYQVMGDKWSSWCAPPALAEGWVQRVLNNVTPFNQRMTDLYENKAETAVSMIQQAGRPFTGDVALNQDNLTSVGLIQLYETILNKAESLSLLLKINDAGANKQLLLAVERLGDLYKVLGDEAYSDAKNPTIGFGEKMEFMDQVDFASEASSLFCFDNQVNSLLDEELCLLRGRSGVSAPTTRMGPYYNRLIWNFTKGITAGEVAYAVNYNVNGTETVALSEEQAARVYPQGHGDAYGHYLSALKGWYRLLRNPYFSWGKPAQGEMNLADSAVNVDYYEEAKFAEAAADLAKTAADVVDLSARKAWRDNGKDSSGYLDSNPTNAFGCGEWATRGGYGALVNWVTANSILPEDCTLKAVDPDDVTSQDTAYQDKGLTRIDRGTVDELADICESADRIQAALDRIDAGLNPLGLSDHAVPFDIAPNGASDGSNTHFEQVRDRAKTALANARKVLDRAQTQAGRMRMIAETAENYAGVIASEEEDFDNQLIGYYGTPYSDDIGPGKTYKQGYNGPDLIHYMWMDLDQYGLDARDVQTAYTKYTDISKKVTLAQLASAVDATAKDVPLFCQVTASGLAKKPGHIKGRRAAPGSIQMKYDDLVLQYKAVKNAEAVYNKNRDLMNFTRSWSFGMSISGGALVALRKIFDIAETDAITAKASFDRAMSAIDKEKEYGTAQMEDLKNAVPSVVGAGMSVVTSPRSLVEAVLKNLDARKYTGAELRTEITNMYVDSLEGHNVLKNLLESAEAAFKYAKEAQSYANEYKSAVLAVISSGSNLETEVNKLCVCVDAVNKEIGDAEAVLDKREATRKRQVSQLSQLRYNEMLFRKFRDKSLTRYTAAFDLAQKYVYMAAQVYDYETALKRDNEGSGDAFKTKIVSTRSLGAFDGNGEPMVADDGDLGLSGYLAQMDANWQVMKPRLGINNPQPYTTWFSLRGELFRILDGEAGDAAWAKELDKHWVDDILTDSEFKRYCQPFQSQFGIKDKEPGLIIPFETTIDFAKNLFGNELAGGDHAYDSSWYSTRIAAAGVWFDGYNGKTTNAVSSAKAQLVDTPVVYLVPVGYDCLRAPGLADGTYWQFSVVDQVIAAPYNIGSYELDSDTWMPSLNDADWDGGDATVKIRKHPSFRAYFNPAGGAPTDDRLDATRLIGRSVWNTRWLLVIPAGAMNADREKALSVFINGSDTDRDGTLDLKPVSDIKIGFRTYSQSGN